MSFGNDAGRVENFTLIIDFGSNLTLPTTIPVIFIQNRVKYYPIIKKFKRFI
jgi:hypothetical protein